MIALWAWAEMPTRRPARTSSTIIRAAGVRLAGPGRSLDRQDRLGLRQADGEPAAGRSTALTGLDERIAGRATGDPRRPAQQEVADRPVRSVAVDAVRDDGVGQPAERLAQSPCRRAAGP